MTLVELESLSIKNKTISPRHCEGAARGNPVAMKCERYSLGLLHQALTHFFSMFPAGRLPAKGGKGAMTLVEAVGYLKLCRIISNFNELLNINTMATGETNLTNILKTLTPELNAGEYIFHTTHNPSQFNDKDVIGLFKEKEGVTVIIPKAIADSKNIPYTFVASWITLNVHSSLSAVGLTAAFSTALTNENISANVIAGYYHDHIFVATEDAGKAMKALIQLSVVA